MGRFVFRIASNCFTASMSQGLFIAFFALISTSRFNKRAAPNQALDQGFKALHRVSPWPRAANGLF
jgi:hypothetical protein